VQNIARGTAQNSGRNEPKAVPNPSDRQERAFLVGVEFRSKGRASHRGKTGSGTITPAAQAARDQATGTAVSSSSLSSLSSSLCSSLPAASPDSSDFTSEESLDELRTLATSAGAQIAGEFTQRKDRPDPATLIGKGKLEEIAGAAASVSADVILFDHDLSPSQQRNIERVVHTRVIDRTQLILDIFARRARTREGKLQVELAQLKYLLPRLVGAGDALSRLGGGIGTRGPGETKLETDRRRIRTRIHAVSDDIEQVRKRRGQLRSRRHKAAVPTVALVGYTNAGKTTLFNVLTRADAEASNALFVTLDPLVRQVRLPDSRELLVSDTVGFIDRLPHALVAAFRATLEELADADLVLHVIDASAPDRDRRMNAVRQVLAEVGATTPGGRGPRIEDVPMIDVYNKCDALTADEKRRLQEQDPAAVRISALTRDGVDELVDMITSRLALDVQRVTLTFDPDDAGDRERMARLYRHGRVVQHETRDGEVSIVADVPRRLVPRLERL
jgi:GTP-binding protein HflX